MDIKRKSKDFLTKLQNMPEHKKKIVLWTIVAIFAIFLGYLWILATIANFQKLQKNMDDINLPKFETSPVNILQTTSPSNENPISTKIISEKDAIKLVKNLPEVKNWLSLFSQPDGSNMKTGGKPFIDLDHQDDNTYFIHAYELTTNHLATFNWYDVDKKTGNIKSEF